MNHKIITNQHLNILTEEYCLNLIKEYKNFNFMILNEDTFNKENDKLFDTINFLTQYKNIEFHLIVIVSNIHLENRVREFFPDFSTYPTTILFKNGEIFETLEGKYIVKN